MHTSSKTINIELPKSWSDLSQKELKFLFSLLACPFSADEIKTLCLVRWANLKMKFRYKDQFVVSINNEKFLISPLQIVAAFDALNWINELPKNPVRIDQIKKHIACTASFENVSFEKFIICDNLYQGYLSTKSDKLLLEMAKAMYSSNKITLTKWQTLSIFYWFASLKEYLANTFSSFLQPVSSTSNNLLAQEQSSVRDAMNAQIRALTKGDITKEKDILAMDTWRALTELDAIAKDYEIQKQQLAKYGK